MIRRQAGEHFIQENAKAVDIRGGPYGLDSSAGLFGRHVTRGTHDVARLPPTVVRLHPLGHAKVGNLGHPI